MAGQLLFDGELTAIPAVVVRLKFEPGEGPVGSAGVPCLVGKFPFLQGKTPAFVTSKARLIAMCDVGGTMGDEIRDIARVLAKSSKSNQVGFPSRVGLCSVVDTTQAFNYLRDNVDANSLKLISRLYGTVGNALRVEVGPHPSLANFYLFEAVNNGKTEKFKIPVEPALLALRYDYGGASAPSGSVVGFDNDGGGSGVVNAKVDAEGVTITFIRTIPASVVDAAPGSRAWYSRGPVYGQLTVTPDAAATLDTGTFVAVFHGVTAADGPTTETLTWTVANVTDAVAKATTKDFIGDVELELYTTGGGVYTGDTTVAGKNFKPMIAAEGQTFVDDVIGVVSAFNAQGFYAATNSSRSSTTKVTDLDYKANANIISADTPVLFTALAFRIAAVINASSTLVSAERVGTLAPDLDEKVFVAFGGGTEDGSITTADWVDAFKATKPFKDITDVLLWREASEVADDSAPEDDGVFEAALEHIDQMRGLGASERFLHVGGPALGATLDTRIKWAKAFNDEACCLYVRSPDIIMDNGATKQLTTRWHALTGIARICGATNNYPLTDDEPDWAGYRDTDGSDDEEIVNELIVGGCQVVWSQGDGRPYWVRDVTTWTGSDDPKKTSRPAVKSAYDISRFVRDKVKVWKSNPDASSGAIEGTIENALEAGSERGRKIIRDYLPESVRAQELSDRFNGFFKFYPRVPKDFIVMEGTAADYIDNGTASGNA